MPNQTNRLQLQLPLGADLVAELRLAVTNIANTLDAAVTFLTGSISALPAASLAGRRYYATDIGQELYDTGSKWIPVGSAVPVGALSQYAGATDPVDADGTTRWMLCNGRVLAQASYTALFGIVGATYNTGGEGGGNFRVPDLRGRVAIGADSGGAHLPANHPALGVSGGEEQHTLGAGEMPVHNHGVTDPQHAHQLQLGIDGPFAAGSNAGIRQGSGSVLGGGGSGNGLTQPVGTGISIQNAGSGTAHNNLQPYLAINHIIKVL